MDYHSRKLHLLGVIVCLCVFACPVFGLSYHSFGRSVCRDFGPDYLMNPPIIIDIYVPIAGKVLDVDLALDVTHSSICDLQIFIKSPTSNFLYINGYDKDNFNAYLQDFKWAIFDAEATSILDTSIQGPFSGQYKPNGPDNLTTLYGGQSQGIWQVMISDVRYFDTGTLNGVRLDFYINPEPATFLIFSLGSTIVLLKQKGV